MARFRVQRGEFPSRSRRALPTQLSASRFDVVYAVSVFSHFDEGQTDEWLGEIARLLRPGGLFIASTLSPNLTWTRPDLSEEDHRRLQRDGFLFAPGSGPFNENGTFSSRERLLSRWGQVLEPRSFEEHGLAGYQDLSVWEKARASSRSLPAALSTSDAILVRKDRAPPPTARRKTGGAARARAAEKRDHRPLVPRDRRLGILPGSCVYAPPPPPPPSASCAERVARPVRAPSPSGTGRSRGRP